MLAGIRPGIAVLYVMITGIVTRLLAAILFLFSALVSAAAEDYSTTPLNQRVLVVYNSWTKDSLRVAKYYMAKRHIPEANKCALKIDDQESQNYTILPWDALDKDIKSPIKKCLEVVGKNKVIYIVFSYETPFKIYPLPKGNGKAVDQYVADIWDDVGPGGREQNPYNLLLHGANGPPHYMPLAAYRDLPKAKMIYSVWRLDGHTASEAEGLVDKAIEAESKGLRGQVCIDRRGGDDMKQIPEFGYGDGEWSLHRAAEVSRRAGFHVIEDANNAEFGTAPAPLRCDDAALYAGWYSLNSYFDVFQWNPGAIGIHMDSESATSPRLGKSWVASALAHGITVTAGSVDEPYLQGLPSPDVIFAALYDGANVGDAFLRGERWLKWMLINIGDPLYRPFPNGRPTEGPR